MFHVLELDHDHPNVVFSGQLSQATGYVMERYGKPLDEAIRSGIRILYTDALHGPAAVLQAAHDGRVSSLQQPIDDDEIV